MVDGRRRGNGRREYFKEIDAAKARAEQLVIERENHGTAALNFPVQDRVMAVECRELLRPFGKTIRDATAHYIEWLNAEAVRLRSPFIRECAVQFMEARHRDVARGDLARRSLVEFRHFCAHMTAALGGRRIAEFDTEVAQNFLDSFPVAARTRQNIRLRLSKFLNFCRSKKWIAVNPCAEIKIKVRRGEVEVLSVDHTESLLRECEASKYRSELVPYAALCLFAGLRPHEAQQLCWEQIDLTTLSIHVLPHTSKRREGRYVHIEPMLVDWLNPYVADGRVCTPSFRRHWRFVTRSIGYNSETPWPQDVMRHTAASMLLAIKRNRALVAEELGTSVDVLRRHYRKPILQSEAQRFWMLKPGD
jgi:integrase